MDDNRNYALWLAVKTIVQVVAPLVNLRLAFRAWNSKITQSIVRARPRGIRKSQLEPEQTPLMG